MQVRPPASVGVRPRVELEDRPALGRAAAPDRGSEVDRPRVARDDREQEQLGSGSSPTSGSSRRSSATSPKTSPTIRGWSSSSTTTSWRVRISSRGQRSAGLARGRARPRRAGRRQFDGRSCHAIVIARPPPRLACVLRCGRVGRWTDRAARCATVGGGPSRTRARVTPAARQTGRVRLFVAAWPTDTVVAGCSSCARRWRSQWAALGAAGQLARDPGLPRLGARRGGRRVDGRSARLRSERAVTGGPRARDHAARPGRAVCAGGRGSTHLAVAARRGHDRSTGRQDRDRPFSGT